LSSAWWRSTRCSCSSRPRRHAGRARGTAARALVARARAGASASVPASSTAVRSRRTRRHGGAAGGREGSHRYRCRIAVSETCPQGHGIRQRDPTRGARPGEGTARLNCPRMCAIRQYPLTKSVGRVSHFAVTFQPLRGVFVTPRCDRTRARRSRWEPAPTQAGRSGTGGRR
jgi:hypothetical protein